MRRQGTFVLASLRQVTGTLPLLHRSPSPSSSSSPSPPSCCSSSSMKPTGRNGPSPLLNCSRHLLVLPSQRVKQSIDEWRKVRAADRDAAELEMNRAAAAVPLESFRRDPEG